MLKWLNFSFAEILGAALPIGSKNQTSFEIYLCNVSKIYLNAGSGNPCAGQTKAIEEDLECTNVELLSADENFGLALPIGSKYFDRIKSVNGSNKNYLNDGTGAPWAGQDSEIISFSFLTKRLNLVSEENFGAAPPMGSVDDIKKDRKCRNCTKLFYFFCLNAGAGDTFFHQVKTINNTQLHRWL